MQQRSFLFFSSTRAFPQVRGIMWPGQLFRSDHFVWEGWQMAACFGFLSTDVGGSSGPWCGKLQCHHQCLPTGWAVATGTELVWGTKQSATSKWLKRVKRDSIRFGWLCSPKSTWLFFNDLKSILSIPHGFGVLESAIWSSIEEPQKRTLQGNARIETFSECHQLQCCN